jgi:hypothetical protein
MHPDHPESPETLAWLDSLEPRRHLVALIAEGTIKVPTPPVRLELELRDPAFNGSVADPHRTIDTELSWSDPFLLQFEIQAAGNPERLAELIDLEGAKSA